MAPTVHTPPINTYIPIGSITLAAATSSVTFSGIPTTDSNGNSLRDLILVAEMIGTGGDGLCSVRVNGDTGSNYSNVYAWGESPSSTGSGSSTTTYILNSITGVGTSPATFNTLQFQDFSASDKHKTVLIRSGYGTNNTWMGASRWASLSAISSITLAFTGTNQFAINSTFSLYALAG